MLLLEYFGISGSVWFMLVLLCVQSFAAGIVDDVIYCLIDVYNLGMAKY